MLQAISFKYFMRMYACSNKSERGHMCVFMHACSFLKQTRIASLAAADSIPSLILKATKPTN